MTARRGVFWVFLFITIHADAVVISPTVLEMNTDKRSVKQLTVSNTSSEKLPLEVGVYKLRFTKDGSYTTHWVSNETVLVFPPAAVLAPGAKQTFRVQWLADTPPIQSHSYFVRFSQLTLTEPTPSPAASQVAFQLHYSALLHVVADNHQADVVLQVNEQGERFLVNRGNRFTYTSAVAFRQSEQAQKKRWDEVLGERFIPPLSVTRLPNGLDIPAGQYHGLVF